MKRDLTATVTLRLAYSENFIYIGACKEQHIKRINLIFPDEELKIHMEVEVPLIMAKQFKHAAKNACKVAAIPAGAYPPKSTRPNHKYHTTFYNTPFVRGYLEDNMSYLIQLMNELNNQTLVDIEDDFGFDVFSNN